MNEETTSTFVPLTTDQIKIEPEETLNWSLKEKEKSARKKQIIKFYFDEHRIESRKRTRIKRDPIPDLVLSDNNIKLES